jgi:hypothetical protein
VAVFVGYFTCSTEEAARRLANTIQVVGLQAQLQPPRLPGEPWKVSAPAELNPTPANLAQLQRTMGEAARRAGARFHTLRPES